MLSSSLDALLNSVKDVISSKTVGFTRYGRIDLSNTRPVITQCTGYLGDVYRTGRTNCTIQFPVSIGLRCSVQNMVGI